EEGGIQAAERTQAFRQSTLPQTAREPTVPRGTCRCAMQQSERSSGEGERGDPALLALGTDHSNQQLARVERSDTCGRGAIGQALAARVAGPPRPRAVAAVSRPAIRSSRYWKRLLEPATGTGHRNYRSDALTFASTSTPGHKLEA